MKLLFAGCCMDLVVPIGTANQVKYCKCGKCCVWWENPFTGQIAVYGPSLDEVSIIGIHNGLLSHPNQSYISKDIIQNILRETSDYYLFKTMESLIIRFQPGNTSDSKFVKDKESIPK
jgi:hypothetical protein